MLTIVVRSPSSEETLRKNPLGLYVDAVDWSRELDVPPPAPPRAERPQAPASPSLPLGSPLDPDLAAPPAFDPAGRSAL